MLCQMHQHLQLPEASSSQYMLMLNYSTLKDRQLPATRHSKRSIRCRGDDNSQLCPAAAPSSRQRVGASAATSSCGAALHLMSLRLRSTACSASWMGLMKGDRSTRLCGAW